MAGRPLRRKAFFVEGRPLPEPKSRRIAPLISPRIAPRDWAMMNDTQRLVSLFSHNLENILKLVSIPFEEADLHERTLQVRVFEIAMKVGINLSRINAETAGREAILRRLTEAMQGKPSEDAETVDLPWSAQRAKVTPSE